jgi:uncharacterized protein (TIRG00374 family)
LSSSIFKSILKYMIAVIILYLLYRSGLMQFQKVSDVLFQPKIFFLGLFLFSLQFVVFSLRWKLISSLKKQISLGKSIQQHLIGQFFNTFVPGGVGGDVIKALRLSNETSLAKSDSLSLTLLDRVFGIFGLVLFSFCFLLMEFNFLDHTTISYFYISSTILFIALICLFFRKNIQNLFLTYSNNIKNKFISKIKDLFSFFFDNLNQMFSQKKNFLVFSH